MTTTLQDLIDDSIFISTEYQARLAEISGGAEWAVDFSAPSFTLQTDASTTLTPYLLGTESEKRGSWIWSWQELGHFPDGVVAAAIQAREGGARESIAELSTDELPLDEGLARKLTLASKALTGIYAHYPVTAGAGVRAWILLSGPQLELGAPTVQRMGQVMAQALQTGTAVNHLRAVDSYAKLRGAHIAWDTEATAVITASDGALRLWFDNGKISGIEPAEPQVGASELERLAAEAADHQQKLAADRQAIERLAASEADQQRSAREAAAAQAAAEAEAAQAAADEAARLAEAEARALEARETAAREAAARAAEAQAAAEAEAEEVEGTTTTDKVYPNVEEPYNQEPASDARPGRVTTSALAQEDLVQESEEPQAQEATREEVAAEEPLAQQTTEVAEAPAAPAGYEVVSDDIRLAGQAPNLEAERQQAEAAQQAKPKEEKKGFFSRFFGL